ncbi:MAG: YjgN family protein, partial [SAR324 cluster bacterium]|nr:YjgN family protein [SAR324 cluster bacterium]
MSDFKLNNSDSAGNEASSVSVSDAEETLLEGSWQLKFEGKGSELFGIFIDNFFLNLLTLGIYYPWAKAKQLRY